MPTNIYIDFSGAVRTPDRQEIVVDCGSSTILHCRIRNAASRTTPFQYGISLVLLSILELWFVEGALILFSFSIFDGICNWFVCFTLVIVHNSSVQFGVKPFPNVFFFFMIRIRSPTLYFGGVLGYFLP